MRYTYRIMAEKLSNSEDDAPTSATFQVTNHDDIVPLIARVKALHAVPEADVPALTVGLKLFLDVMMRHRRSPLFQPLHPHMLDFMARLKGAATPDAAV